MARKISTKARVILRSLEDSVSGLDQTLILAYLSTIYCIEWTPAAVISLRIDALEPAFQQLLEQEGIHTFAIITACNPRSQLLTPAENMKRHAQLLRRLAEKGLTHKPTRHLCAQGDWPDEWGCWVPHIELSEAAALCADFDQNAMVWWEKPKGPQLFWTKFG